MHSYELLDEYDALDDAYELPEAPTEGALRTVAIPGEPLQVLQFIGIATVDYSAPEPDVGWRGGPAVLWTFQASDGRMIEVSPEEVVE